LNRIFYLVMMTIFAVLFLVTYYVYSQTKEKLQQCGVERDALYALVDGRFDEFSKKLDLKEHQIAYYASKFFQFQLGKAYMEVRRGNYGKALEDIEKALAVAQSPSELSEGLIFKAAVLEKMGRYEEAVKVLKIVIEEKLPGMSSAVDGLRRIKGKVKDEEMEKLIESILSEVNGS